MKYKNHAIIVIMKTSSLIKVDAGNVDCAILFFSIIIFYKASRAEFWINQRRLVHCTCSWCAFKLLWIALNRMSSDVSNINRWPFCFSEAWPAFIVPAISWYLFIEFIYKMFAKTVYYIDFHIVFADYAYENSWYVF